MNNLPNALIVFGGTGFVGTAVIAEALNQDSKLHIFVISRTGTPPKWVQEDTLYQTERLHFLSGNLLAPATFRHEIKEILSSYRVIACISCVGAITPWSNKNMVQTCGDANINAYTIAKEIGALKFVVMTRDRSNEDDWWYPFQRIIPGYYEGKDKIESYIQDDKENFGNAICLRAGFVTGTRKTIPGLPTSIKLRVPMEGAYKLVEKLCPVINVEVLAAAVRFALSNEKANSVLVLNANIPDYFKNI